jgi:hypothetical protein
MIVTSDYIVPRAASGAALIYKHTEIMIVITCIVSMGFGFRARYKYIASALTAYGFFI